MKAYIAAAGAGIGMFTLLTVAGSATATAPTAKRVAAPADIQFTLECNTHSSSAVADAVEAYMEADAVVSADGKTHYVETDLVNGKGIDPKLATAKVTVTELPNQGGYMYELDGRLDEDGENTPNEFCHDTQIYRSKPAADVVKPVVTVTEAQSVSAEASPSSATP